jgi:hypothetical protein
MNNFLNLLVAVNLIFFLNIETKASASGTYTIGGTAPDYTSFFQAISAITGSGISGNVIFKVRDGVYNEQVSIPQITGMSANATITFTSESNDSTKVILSYASTSASNYTLQLNGADYITFSKITIAAISTPYGYAVDIKNSANHNVFSNCVLKGPTVSSVTTLSAVINCSSGDYNIFSNNRISNGSYAIVSIGSYSQLTKGTIIERNIIENQYYQALQLNSHDSLIVSQNTINTNSSVTNFFGIYCTNCNNQFRIDKNKVYIPQGGIGIYAYNCLPVSTSKGLISNNFIQVGGTSLSYGIDLYNTNYVQVYNNNVNITNTSTNSCSFYDYSARNSNSNYVANNILVNTGGGYTLYVASSNTVSSSDYNDLYATGTNCAYWNGDQPTLNNLKSASGTDAHSIALDPLFVSPVDLHVREGALNAAGVHLAEVTDDMDGVKRNLTNPDIGADEISLAQNDAGLILLKSPKAPFKAGIKDVIVLLKNQGDDVLKNATINWTINGVAQTTLSWTGALASNDTVSVKLGTYNFTTGVSYSIKSWVSLPTGLVDSNHNNDTVKVSNLYTQLSGVYTIGGTAPSFTSFTQAVNALISNGIAGNVIFKVRNGSYNEQISIPQITGISANTGITFESETGDSTMVTLSYASSAYDHNYTLQLNGATYITFRKMTIAALNTSYGKAIDITNASNYNKFEECLLKGIETTNTSSDLSIVFYSGSGEFNVFRNNKISNGSYGIANNGTTNTLQKGTCVDHNIFENQYYQTIYFTLQDSLTISQNTIKTGLNYSAAGISLYNCKNQFKIIKNKISVPTGTYGISITNCIAASSMKGLVANNFVQVGGSYTAYGIYISSSDYLGICNNNINITSTSTGAYALYGYSDHNSGTNYIINNVLANTGGGYALYVYSPNMISSSDYNDLYSTGTNCAYWQGNKLTLSDLKAVSGMDTHSVSLNPLFISPVDLHVREGWLNASGTHLAEITDDIDGEARNATKPDIGADEFNLPQTDAGLLSLKSPKMPFRSGARDVNVILENMGADNLKSATINWTMNGTTQTPVSWTGNIASNDTISVKLGTYTFNIGTAYSIKSWVTSPNGLTDANHQNDTSQVTNIYACLSGIYTIGGNNPDFKSFASAITALNGGVADSVVFKVRNGTYNEQINIPQVVGTSKKATVTFTSETGDSTGVIVSFSSTTSAANYVVQLNGADYFNFYKITLRATNSSYGNVINLTNGSSQNTFGNCILQSIGTSGAVINSYDETSQRNVFRNNKLLSGGYGIYCSLSATGRGIVIEKNSFENQNYGGMYFSNEDSVIIRNNTITNSTNNSFTSIYCNYCNNLLKIEKNKIYASSGGYGIYLNNCLAYTTPGLIANNFIQVGGTSISCGIYLNTSYQNVYNNNVNITGTATGGYGAAIYNTGSSNNVINNIFSNLGVGYAVYDPYSGLKAGISDYNDLFATGPNIAYSSGNLATLKDLQTATGTDAHSISANPQYLSTTDLHVREITLNGAGTPLGVITADIDGENRDATKPDIGADEFTPTYPSDAGIYSLADLKIPFTTGNHNITVNLKNYGADTLKTVAIDWTINSTPMPRVNWSGKLIPGDTTHFKIGTYSFSGLKQYNIKAWTALPNGNADINNFNDTTQVTGLWAGLSGTYKIGGTKADFRSFNNAVTALTQGGVVGNVIFQVRDGIYNDQISIPEIKGASGNATITFEPESGDSTAVSFVSAATPDKNYSIQLTGADYITFRKMTIAALDNNSGNIIDISNNSNHNVFSNCIFQGTNNSHIIYSNSSGNNEYNIFRNNRFNGGSDAFNYAGGSLVKGIVIENNVFENQYYYAINVSNLDSVVIRNNKINYNSASGSRNNIYCLYSNRLRIEKNWLSAPTGGIGIYLNNCGGTSTSQSLIANNFIQTGGTGTAYGIYVVSSNYQKIYNNNINVTSTSLTMGKALFIDYSNYSYVVNNILVNTGGGYAYYVSNPGNISVSDYNDLYSTGPNVAYWGANKAGLQDLQLAGSDLHSVSQNPLFISNVNLHVQETYLNGKGTPVPEITDDIDNELRNTTKPDIGADEFTPFQTDASLYTFRSPVAPFLNGKKDVVVLLKNQGTDTLKSVIIDWTVNEDQQVRKNWTGSLVPGDTTSVNLGVYSFIPGTKYNIKGWTMLPNGKTDSNNHNDTIQTTNLFSALCGVYTIGGSNPDFQSFTKAVTALVQGGVAGNVTFKVRSGNYNEQISIPEILGTSANSTITFESANLDSTSVKLSYSSENYKIYLLQLAGADYTTFRKMTFVALNNDYASLIDIRNNSNHNTISNCVLQQNIALAIINSEGSIDNYNTFSGNKFIDGGVGINLYGESNTQLEKGTKIENNVFLNQVICPMNLYYQDSLVIRNNTTSTNSANNGFSPLKCTYCNNSLNIEKNKLNASNGGYGIYLAYCIGTLSNYGIISNNFIKVGDENKLADGGIVATAGIYLDHSNYQKIYNNNVHIPYKSSDASALSVSDNDNTRNIDVVNNIFCNTGGGYAMYTSSPKLISNSDYNDLYTTGPNLAYWNGDKAGLSDLRTMSSKDVHSVSINPQFYSTTDLHVREILLNKAGIPLAGITDDIDGNPRDAKFPDIGADEFTLSAPNDAGIIALHKPKLPFLPVSQDVRVVMRNFGSGELKTATVNWSVNNVLQTPFQWKGSLMPALTDTVNIGTYNFVKNGIYTIKVWSSVPNGMADTINYNDTLTVKDLNPALSGTYTIGGYSPDFKTFTEAANKLQIAGVAGTVVFNVRAGTYREHFIIGHIPGASASNTVQFQAENKDSTSVILMDSVSTCVVQLNGADYITFYHLTIRNKQAYYGNVIELKNGASYNRFLNNNLQSGSTSNNGTAVIYSLDSLSNYNQFKSNTFLNGSYGIELQGYINNYAKGNLISNNSFIEQKGSTIQLTYQDGPVITANIIKFATNQIPLTACHIDNCKGSLVIAKNKILFENDGYGIYVINFNGTATNQGLIANNFISIGGTLAAYGMNLVKNTYLNVYNNNVCIRNTVATSSALFYANGENNNIASNVFSNQGGGYAVNFNELASITLCDYNNLYTTGSVLACYYNQLYKNLDEWKQGSKSDLHAISIDPMYISNNDLHVTQIALDGAGIPIPVITDDIDGQLRDSNTPDIGADEFKNTAHNIGITAILPASGCMLSSAEQVKVTIKNFGAYPESGFNVTYQIDNQDPVTEKVNQTITAGGSMVYVFINKANLSGIRTYSLKAYSGLGGDDVPANDTLTIAVTNMQKLVMQLTKDTVICTGSSITLSANAPGATSYKWSTGSSGNMISVNPMNQTTYMVTATNIFNCAVTDTVTVSLHPLSQAPVISPAGPIVLCNNDHIKLTSNIDNHIVWSSGAKTQSIVVNSQDTYTVKYTDNSGCTVTSAPVAVWKEVVPYIEPKNPPVCSSTVMILSVKNAKSYTWSTGASTSAIKVLPLTTTTYSVTATTPMGCTYTDSSQIFFIPSKIPAQVSNMIPINDANDLSLPIDFSWMPAENATSYDVYIWPTDEPRPTHPITTKYFRLRYDLLSYGITYKWQVVSKYYSCDSTLGPVQTFTVRELPDLVVKNVQFPNAAFTGQNIDITWEICNQGIGSTVSAWHDDLSLAIDTVLDRFYTLGAVENMTYLGSGQCYVKKASFTLPGHIDGLFNVFASTNTNKDIRETDYNNNQCKGSYPIWVKLTPPPDLFVSSITTPTDFFSEDTVNVSWTVVNNGKWATGTNCWTDRIYIAKDFNNGLKYNLASFYHMGDSILKPGRSYSASVPVKIPVGIYGKYYIFVETDVNNNVIEDAYDGNNVTQSDSVNVFLRPPPDLMVADIKIPQKATNLSLINVRWTVKNIGNKSVNDKNWYDAIYLSKSPNYDLSTATSFLYQRSYPNGIPLDFSYANSEFVQISKDIEPGDYYVYVKTDAKNGVFEYLNKSNNILRSDTTIKVSITPWPDLAVSEFHHPDSAGVGETIPVSFTVTNKGAGIASGTWADDVYIWDGYKQILIKEIKRNDPLLQNAFYVINTTVNIPAGFPEGSRRYIFWVVTDSLNSVYERTDKKNNHYTGSVFIKTSDLAVDTIHVPSEVYSGSTAGITWNVRNEGNAGSPALYFLDRVELMDSLNNVLVETQTPYLRSYVKAGDTYMNESSIDIPDGLHGNYFLRFTTDVNNANKENNIDNNIKTVPIKILLRQPSDLIVNSFTSPKKGWAGQPITVQWETRNIGKGATAAKQWIDAIYLCEDTVITPKSILIGTYIRSGGLAPGESYSKSQDIFLPISALGNYNVIVMTDLSSYNNPNGLEYEYKAENNNTAKSFINIDLAAPSDLIVTKILSPAKATTGNPVTITWTIKNIGSNKAEGYLTDMVYFSKDSLWDITDPLLGEKTSYIKLQPNKDTTFSLTTELTGTTVGDYYVLVRTDNKNNISEVNDLNNTLSTTSKVNVEVPLLTLNVFARTTLVNSKGLYYRIEIPDSLKGETLLVKLKGDSIAGSNELYISYNKVPDRSIYDFASGRPFYGNQEVIVPSLNKGTYYLLVYGAAGNSKLNQSISVYAEIIHFQIRSVQVNEGGNKGAVTVEIDGARFSDKTKFKLQSNDTIISGDSLIYIDATKVFVTFNLMDKKLGYYDVIAINEKGDTARLKNGFKVVEYSPFNLVTSVKHPSLIRIFTVGIITLQFANQGNIDLPVPKFILKSLDDADIAFLRKEIDNNYRALELLLRETNGPQTILRPGATGSIYIWVRPNQKGIVHFMFENARISSKQSLNAY